MDEVNVSHVQGWRAYTLGYVPSLAGSGIGSWQLSGMYGVPVGSNPSPHARCLRWDGFYFDNCLIENPEHLAPHDGCACGYYGLFYPDPSRVPANLVIWAQVDALGKTLICDKPDEDGFKTERVRIKRIFWPCTTKSLQHLYWPNHQVANLKFGIYLMNQEAEGRLDVIMEQVSTSLGLELVREPLANWLWRNHRTQAWKLERD